MYFRWTLLVTLLVIFATNLYALNTTTTTTKAPIVSCKTQSQCAKTHFCNTKQKVCVLKRSLNNSCALNTECTSGKCHGKICRQPCRADKGCSSVKEYCTISNYCAKKHCGGCTRNAQCATNKCRFFRCTQTNCTAIANALNKL